MCFYTSMYAKIVHSWYLIGLLSIAYYAHESAVLEYTTVYWCLFVRPSVSSACNRISALSTRLLWSKFAQVCSAYRRDEKRLTLFYFSMRIFMAFCLALLYKHVFFSNYPVSTCLLELPCGFFDAPKTVFGHFL